MIYDCVLYNDEEIIFDLRYNILKDVVDKFIIIEMDKTFSGKPKPYLFNKVSHNIINIRLKGREIKESSWNCEYRSRNCISTFDFIDDDDYFIMSDLDEIPRPELLPTIGAYELNWYYYYLRECTDLPKFLLNKPSREYLKFLFLGHHPSQHSLTRSWEGLLTIKNRHKALKASCLTRS